MARRDRWTGGSGEPSSGGELERLRAWGRGRGLGRREFLRALGAGGVAAALAACDRSPLAGDEPDAESAAGDGPSRDRLPRASLPWLKDPAPFIRHPTNLETRLERLGGLLTPNDLFFVRNHVPTPRIDPARHRLRVEGSGVEQPVELVYGELRGLPARSVIAYLECAGNWRRFWPEVAGRTARGGPWGTGGVGCAIWTGPSLARVLERAGLRPEAVDVNLVGLDEGGFERPMPIAKALDPDTILAHTMNGAELPPDHGRPLRAVVPGWVGSSSVKWVGRVEVSTERIWSKNNTTSYVQIGPAWPPERYAPAEGGPITVQSVKSVLALPRPARLPAGPQWLHGFAYSPHAPVEAVEWSVDGGRGWQPAELLSPPLRWAWRTFAFRWNASAGRHGLRVRARDARGNGQPEELPFNEKGYLLNVPVPHPVEVG